MRRLCAGVDFFQLKNHSKFSYLFEAADIER